MADNYEGARRESKALWEKAQTTLAGGISHENRATDPFPLYIKHADGSRKWDVDGNEYIDYAMGSGSLLLGHNHPDVVAAIREQATKGTYYANNHPLEVAWGGLVQELIPCAERVRFVASGSEATLLAVRVARAFTGKNKILKFEGHYHGWHDYVAMGVKMPYDEPPSLGILPASVESTVVCPADAASVEEILSKDKDIAAVIFEASGGSWGTIPLPDNFHADMRALADKFGAVLIFDEVITGFRWSPGGMQALVGVTPDLTSLAKILTGGLPGGALAGREELMELLNPKKEVKGKRPPVFHRGTFNANALVSASGVAALGALRDGKPQRHADAIAAKIREGMARVLKKHEISGIIYGDSSTFRVYFGPLNGSSDNVDGLTALQLKSIPPKVVSAYAHAMRARGVEIMSYTGGVTSLAHTEKDVEQALVAFDGAIGELAENGIIAQL